MSEFMKPAPAPWERETVQRCEDRDAYEVVKDANGKVLFDTLNSDVAVIATEHDEDGCNRWDMTGRVNLMLAAAAPEMLAVCEALCDPLRANTLKEVIRAA